MTDQVTNNAVELASAWPIIAFVAGILLAGFFLTCFLLNMSAHRRHERQSSSRDIRAGSDRATAAMEELIKTVRGQGG